MASAIEARLHALRTRELEAAARDHTERQTHVDEEAPHLRAAMQALPQQPYAARERASLADRLARLEAAANVVVLMQKQQRIRDVVDRAVDQLAECAADERVGIERGVYGALRLPQQFTDSGSGACSNPNAPYCSGVYEAAGSVLVCSACGHMEECVDAPVKASSGAPHMSRRCAYCMQKIAYWQGHTTGVVLPSEVVALVEERVRDEPNVSVRQVEAWLRSPLLGKTASGESPSTYARFAVAVHSQITGIAPPTIGESECRTIRQLFKHYQSIWEATRKSTTRNFDHYECFPTLAIRWLAKQDGLRSLSAFERVLGPADADGKDPKMAHAKDIFLAIFERGLVQGACTRADLDSW